MRWLFLLLVLISTRSFSAECTLYEQSHPLYLLTGAHLSTGKCSTCASCHKMGIFQGTPRTCIQCHNGDPTRTAVYRSASHIPTGTIACDSCHNTIAFQYTTSMMNHTVVTSTRCDACHNGSYKSQGVVGALNEPTNHIPWRVNLTGGSTGDCNLCHKSTTTWSSSMNHNGTMGSGAGWCKGCHLSGQNWLGSGQRMSLTHYQKTPVPLDCSQAGCHRPLGTKGSTYKNWD